MKQQLLRVLTLVSIILLAASLFTSCKGKSGDNSSKTTSPNLSGTAGKSATASVSKTTAPSTNKTGSSTNKPDSTNISVDEPSSGDNSNSSDSSLQSDEDNNGQPAGNNSASSLNEKKIDLHGRKFIIASRDAMPSPDSTDIVSQVFYKSLMNGQQKYNMTLEWKLVPGGTDVIATEFINYTMAGIQYCDVIGLATKQAFPKMAENKYIAPINDYVDFNNPLYNTNYMKTCGLWKDKNYGFTRPVYSAGTGVYFNKDIAARDGLPDLYELVDSGNWTWDTFLQLGQQATKDFNGDGIIDQWGIEMHKNDYNGVAFVVSNGGNYFEYRNGRIEFTLDDPKAARALQFMSDLVNVYKVATTQLKTGGFLQGGSFMYFGDLLASGQGYMNGGFNYGFVPPPKGPDVTDYQIVNAGAHMWCFPTNANLDEVIPVFMDMLTIWDPAKPEHVTYDDYLVSYLQSKFQTQRDIDFIIKHFSDPVISMYQSMPDLQKLIDNEVYKKIVQLQTTPAAALNAIRDSAQQIIDAWVETQ